MREFKQESPIITVPRVTAIKANPCPNKPKIATVLPKATAPAPTKKVPSPCPGKPVQKVGKKPVSKEAVKEEKPKE